MNRKRGAPPPAAISGIWRDVALIVLVVSAFVQVAGFDFLNYDDASVILRNPVVRSGLTWSGVRWAFTTTYLFNWVPLTWISHLLDAQLFGLHPAGHHLTNLLIHLLNTVLLFHLLTRLTGCPGRSAFVAALFAVHPLHVESVAWVTLRRDVLMVFFGLLALWAYAGYARRPSVRRYSLALILFFCGLMSKALLVPLPLVLLLLDYWPLGRFSPAPGNKGFFVARRRLIRLLGEKVPFLALSVLIGLVTIHTQKESMGPEMNLDLGGRILHSMTSYVWYLGKSLWPTGLAVFYPFTVLPFRLSFLAGAFLVALTVGVLSRGSRYPYLPVGWFWFLVTLAPAIGVLQVGEQDAADRYSYFSLIGWFLLAVWGIADFARRRRIATAFPAAAALGALLALWGLCVVQTRTWRNDETLFRHALEVTKGNYVALNNMGELLGRRGDLGGAAFQYREAIRARPASGKEHGNLGLVLFRQGKLPEALRECREAVRLDPEEYSTHSALGLILEKTGRPEESDAEYQAALRLEPNDPVTLDRLGVSLMNRGNAAAALPLFQTATRVSPDDARAHFNLGIALAKTGKLDESTAHYRKALALDPRHADAANNLGMNLAKLGRIPEARESFELALKLDPNHLLARRNLSFTLQVLQGQR